MDRNRVRKYRKRDDPFFSGDSLELQGSSRRFRKWLYKRIESIQATRSILSETSFKWMHPKTSKDVVFVKVTWRTHTERERERNELQKILEAEQLHHSGGFSELIRSLSLIEFQVLLRAIRVRDRAQWSPNFSTKVELVHDRWAISFLLIQCSVLHEQSNDSRAARDKWRKTSPIEVDSFRNFCWSCYTQTQSGFSKKQEV